MFDLDRLVRANIKRLVPYSSARQEFTGNGRIFLDANENSFGSSVGGNYNRYPDPLQTAIRKKIASQKDLNPDQIFIGNGSDEAIDLLIRIFCRPGIDQILICPPTYGMYEVAASINDVAVRRANLCDNFELNKRAVLEAVDENVKLIFLCSPNNPTGNLMNREDVLDIAENFDGVVVVDEAYIHFSSQPSLVSELNTFGNLVVLQTFSKAYGLAGLRVGMAFASREIIELLDKIKPPYNVSQASQELVLKALEHRRSIDEGIKQIIQERTALCDALRRISTVVEVYPSEANFLLTKFANADAIYSYLIGEQIVVRNRSSVELCEGCLRITVGTPAENGELIRALRDYESRSI